MITTKFIGATDYRPKRVKATFHMGGPSITIPWDDEVGVGDNHVAVARALAYKYNIAGEWQRGGSTDMGYVFVRRREVVFVMEDDRA